MTITPTTIGLVLLVSVIVLFIVMGVWLVRDLVDYPADRRVARRGVRARAMRKSVRSAAGKRGWQIEEAASRRFPTAQRPRRADPIACTFAVSGATPRAFRAETWSMRHSNAGDAVASSFVQHRLTMPLGVALPRFAVTGENHWRTMLATIPDDLVSGGRRLGALNVYGNDFLLADRLSPLTGELKAGKLWVLVESDELCVIREGDLDADGLTWCVALAARLAAALEA